MILYSTHAALRASCNILVTYPYPCRVPSYELYQNPATSASVAVVPSLSCNTDESHKLARAGTIPLDEEIRAHPTDQFHQSNRIGRSRNEQVSTLRSHASKSQPRHRPERSRNTIRNRPPSQSPRPTRRVSGTACFRYRERNRRPKTKVQHMRLCTCSSNH
jgi:hypothetical protein